MVYLFKGGFWLFLAQIIMSLSSLFLAIVLANILTKGDYGTYKYILSIAGILSIFTLPGIGVSLTRDVARGYTGSLFQAVTTRVRWGFLGSLVAIAFAIYYLVHDNNILAGGMLIVGAALPFFDASSSYSSFLKGLRDFRRDTFYGSAVQIISVGCLAAVAFLTRDTILLVVTYFGVYTLMRLFFLWRIEREVSPDAPSTDDTIRYGKHLSYMNGLGQVAAYADKLLIFHFGGSIQLALYAVATAPADQLNSLFGHISTLLFPRYSLHSEESVKKNMIRKCVLSFVAIAICIAAYCIVVPFFFSLFFPAYTEAAFFSQLFAVSLIAAALDPANTYLRAHERVRELYVSNTVTAVFQLALMAVLTYSYGILGLIVARMLTRIGSSILRFYFVWFPLSPNPSLRDHSA